MDRPPSAIETSGEHLVERSLDDAVGRYRQQRRFGQRLACGGELWWDLESSATVDRSRPHEVRMDSRQAWRVAGRRPEIEVRVDLLETLGSLEVSAEIDVEGTLFFKREWSLSLDEDPWRIRR